MESRTTVLIASAYPLIANSIKDLLENTPNLEVVGCAGTKDEVIRLVDSRRPQVTILDLGIEWSSVAELSANLARRNSHSIIMADDLEEEVVFQMLHAGANGILSRRVDPDLLCRCINAVAGHQVWVSRTIATKLIDRLRIDAIQPAFASQQTPKTEAAPKHAAPARDYGLTPREQEVLNAIGEGLTNKDIAAQLGISEYTVKHHLTKVFDKVGVDTRLELVVIAAHHSLISNRAAVSA